LTVHGSRFTVHSEVVVQLFSGVLEEKGLKELGKELTNAGMPSPRVKG